MSEGNGGPPIRDFVRIELRATLDKFYERREQLTPALEAARELDKYIPKLEKLCGVERRRAPGRRGRTVVEDVEVPPEFEGLTNVQRILAVLLEFDGEDGLPAQAIAAQAGIPSTSIGPVLMQIRKKSTNLELNEHTRHWTLTGAGRERAIREREERAGVSA